MRDDQKKTSSQVDSFGEVTRELETGQPDKAVEAIMKKTAKPDRKIMIDEQIIAELREQRFRDVGRKALRAKKPK
jgi:hypothetical protein